VVAVSLARPERGLDGQERLVQGPIAFGHQHFWLAPEEQGEKQPLRVGHYLLTCDVRLDNRQELSHLLGLQRKEEKQASDAQLILLSYQRWGLACLKRFLGDFAFALWDDRQKRLFLARDALGARDICYYVQNNMCLFASEVSQILAHPDIQPRINDNRVAARLAYLWDKPEETYYEDIYYLPPAHGMIVTADRLQLWRYWDIDPGREIRYPDEQEYAAAYRALLTEAVRCRLRTEGPVGLSLSGGLDSSALAAIAAPMVPEMIPGQERLYSFSYAFDELRSCDERRYIRETVARYELGAAYLPCDDKWTLKNLQTWPISRDTILADPYVLLPATLLAAAQESGIRLLLAGYFGDTLFSGGRYWALDMLRQLRLGALLRTLMENRTVIDWRQALFEDGLRQLLPKQAIRSYRRWRPRAAGPLVLGIHPDLASRTDLRQRLAAESSPAAFSRPGLSHRYRTLTLSVFSQGLAAARHWYNRHGLELAMPYYDRRLVEFVLAIPADVLGRPQQDRLLPRLALKGLVPDSILRRREQTSFVPLRNKGLLDKEKETVQRILTDPLVVKREYIDGEWLQKQKQKKLDMSPGGIMLWTAISLELWLQRYWS
jgi:asparagine synthase (glutamine-hydrolysing)